MFSLVVAAALLVAPWVFPAPRGAGLLCVPVGGGPPARSPHASLRLGVVDLEARPGPAAAHRHRGQAPPPPRPSISHVIPLRLVQTLNLHRWNCNVFGVSRKMSTINYVRNLRGGGVVAARGHRCLALSARWAGCLKPPSPLLVGICVGLKPLSPLRVRNGRFGCVFRLQR